MELHIVEVWQRMKVLTLLPRCQGPSHYLYANSLYTYGGDPAISERKEGKKENEKVWRHCASGETDRTRTYTPLKEITHGLAIRCLTILGLLFHITN